MTNAIVINSKNHSIEITKKFAAAAKRFGTSEYDELQTVRKDYPNYRVEIKTASRKTDSYKGLTYSYMESYIKAHDDEIMLKEFFILCGKTEDGNEQIFSAAASYGEIKKWFLEAHPEISFQRNRIDEILHKKSA